VITYNMKISSGSGSSLLLKLIYFWTQTLACSCSKEYSLKAAPQKPVANDKPTHLTHHLKANKVVLSLFLLLCCFSQNSHAVDDAQQQSYHAGFLLDSFPDIERVDLEVALQFWAEQISKQKDIPASVTIYKDIKKMQKDFNQQKINFIVLSPLLILDYFDLKQLADGFKVYAADLSSEELLVVSNKDSNINSVNDFKNKKLSLLQNDAICEMYANTLTLDKFNLPSKIVFNHIDYIYKSPQLIYKLFFKKTDVILVYQRAYELAIELNPQIKHRTQIIHKLPNINRGLGFFHQAVDPQFRERVINILENIHRYPAGQQLLNIFFADKVIRSTVKDLQVLFKLKQKHLKLIDNQLSQK